MEALLIYVRHLEDLDEDLLMELDATAQRMQRDCSIFARSGALEEQLAVAYPDLALRIKQEKQIKIDSIVLLNKYSETDTRGSSSYKAGSFHERFEASIQSKTRRKSSTNQGAMATPSPTASPALRGKRSTADLIFEMDDEEDDDDDDGDDKTVSPLPSLTDRLQAVALSGASTPGNHAQTSSWRLDQQPESSPFNRSTLEQPSPQTTESNPLSSVPSRPWGAAPLASSKLGLQEIMAQASSTRTSNISLGLSAAPGSERKTSGSFKPSQKERKKQQIQQGTKSAPIIAPAAEPSSSPASPWQIAKPKPVTRVSSDVLPSGQSPVIASPRTPHLTMRQTVANPSSSAKQKTAMAPSTPSQRSQTRKVSTATSYPSPATSQPSSSYKRPTSSSMAKPLQTESPGLSVSDKPVPIQSIRHIPQQTSSYTDGVHLTMEEILSQQLIEKTVIKDFAAKRSLQEIQQEQEFQEWWDKESARIREEEELAAKETGGRAERKDTVSSGRGGRGGKRRGRGGATVGGGRTKGRSKAESSLRDGAPSIEK
jgi:hypothetical protein